MIDRCNNPEYSDYARYGGSGIRVCRRWLSFDKFMEDMAPRPLGHTIDRIDPDGGYEPSNCRWATPQQQNENLRTAIPVEVNGERYPTIASAARATGIPYCRIYRAAKTAAA